MDELWLPLEEFPPYQVSNLGQVRSGKTGRILQPSWVNRTTLKVSLIQDGVVRTKSVKALVAEMFLDGRSEMFNTAITLDGDPSNLNVDNLAWRPRWFAVRYAQQFDVRSPYKNVGPVRDIATGEVFRTIGELGALYGLLFHDIWTSMHYRVAVFPTGQFFEAP